MRSLNNVEQAITKKIVENVGRDNVIANLMDVWLADIAVTVTRVPEKKVEIKLCTESWRPSPEETELMLLKQEEVTNLMVTMISLLNQFEKEGYLLLVQRTSNFDFETSFGQGIGCRCYMTSAFRDDELVELLCKYAFKNIYVTEELNNFVNNGFIDQDQHRFQEQIKLANAQISLAQKGLRKANTNTIIATVGIFISALASLWTIFMGKSTDKQVRDQATTKNSGVRKEKAAEPQKAKTIFWKEN